MQCKFTAFKPVTGNTKEGKPWSAQLCEIDQRAQGEPTVGIRRFLSANRVAYEPGNYTGELVLRNDQKFGLQAEFVNVKKVA
jgi:hypothetical protein